MTYQNTDGRRQKAEAGFTIVELMITMVAFVFVIAAASQMLTGLMTQFKQQSKITETNIEGIIGLNILRQDIEHAGLGLPWNVTGVDSWGDVTGYSEATDTTYNDAPNNAPSAFRSGDGGGPDIPNADYLVIKSASAATDIAAGKNTRLAAVSPYVRTWGSSYDLSDTDRVIVLSPGGTDASARALVVAGGSYYPQYSTIKASSSYTPVDNTDVRLVYGISDNSSLRAPFNRTDYYISTANPPTRCVAGTGVLVKATLDHSTGTLSDPPMPLLDCVADLQVVYAMDNNEDGDFQNGTGGDAYTNTLAGTTPELIRTRVKEVQVYILAHEGQRDPNFTFNNFTGAGNSVIVGRSSAFGNDFDLTAIADYENYRWKVYTISVLTGNLGS